MATTSKSRRTKAEAAPAAERPAPHAQAPAAEAPAEPSLPEGDAGRRRVVIESVWPEIDGGRHFAKSVVGDLFEVEATIYADGHDVLSAVVLWRAEEEAEWHEAPMTLGIVDRWKARFPTSRLGRSFYTVEAWVDHFRTWRSDIKKKYDAGQELDVDLKVGARLVADAAEHADGAAAETLRVYAHRIGDKGPAEERVAQGLEDELATLMWRHAPRRYKVTHPRILTVSTDPVKARYSTWYELFPRSWSPEPGRHGTFEDVEGHLDRIEHMGFDVLYFPPIHPIGRVNRKGPNNRTVADAGDPGSPWAIGSEEGGHKSVHPELGTLEDFRRLVRVAREDHGIEVALDIAFQCAPDHPYVKEHPEWFTRRPDGTIQYAENPPKKYEDIYPFDFESADWPNLWRELKSVFEFWIGEGVRIFRVDNPHTKSLRFWEWCIASLKREHPETVYLSESFTRPAMMKGLAKLGFTQSYTYFAWKNSKQELEEWWREFGMGEATAYYRPNLWPNTPDILNAHLQHGGRAAFAARLVLAATMGASYGMYAPAFELMESVPREPGSEEYLDSEKYQIRQWDLDRGDSLKPLVTRINRIRRENPALHADRNFRFHPVDNPQIIAYSKHSPEHDNLVLTIVNLDPFHRQSGWVDLPLEALGLDPTRPYQLHDLVSDARYVWHGHRGFVQLDPWEVPAHVFRVRRWMRTEADFDYYA